MTEISSIETALKRIVMRIDQSKCVPSMGAVSDGFFLDVKSLNPAFCPLFIEITPFVFDISAGDGFVESDVSCGDYNFEDVIVSLLSGHARTIAVKLFSFIPRVALEVPLPGGVNFYMVRNGIGPDRRGAGRSYDNCLKPALSEPPSGVD
jgi:hypothetical protein